MLDAVVQIDGGVGRCLCAVPAVEAMAKERQVTVISSHPEVFLHNPHIHKVYGLNREYLFDDVIQYGEFFYPEPYWDYNFYQNKKHMIQSFSSILKQEESGGKPNIYLSCNEKEEAKNYIGEIKRQIGKRKIIAFQPFGASLNFATGIDPTNRSLPFNAVDFILSNLYEDCCFINFTSCEIKNPAMCVDQFPLRKLFALLPHCDYVITIDSFLCHAGYAMGVLGTQIFGGTSVLNFGYPDHYHTVCREGYPKSYMAFRMSGCLEKNQGAMDFTEDELRSIIAEIKNRLATTTSCSCTRNCNSDCC